MRSRELFQRAGRTRTERRSPRRVFYLATLFFLPQPQLFRPTALLGLARASLVSLTRFRRLAAGRFFQVLRCLGRARRVAMSVEISPPRVRRTGVDRGLPICTLHFALLCFHEIRTRAFHPRRLRMRAQILFPCGHSSRTESAIPCALFALALRGSIESLLRLYYT